MLVTIILIYGVIFIILSKILKKNKESNQKLISLKENEEILIQSELYDTQQIIRFILICGVLFAIFSILSDDFYRNSSLIYKIGSAFPFFFSFFLGAAIIYYYSIDKIKIIVTNKRITGTSIFGKRVDLPLDMISAVEMFFFKGIGVCTSSGVIRFLAIKNQTKIHEKISKLLVERQDNKENTRSTINASNTTDELREYKRLLDDGIISKEDFDKKKKELLNKKN